MYIEQNPDQRPTGSPNVQLAFRLGWRLAQVYHRPPPATPASEGSVSLPPHLPGASELSPYDQSQLLVSQIEHDATALAHSSKFDLDDKTKTFSLVASAGGGVDTTRLLILNAFKELRSRLATTDAQLGRAIDLGRMLADTVALVEADKPETLNGQFNHFRLTNAYEWLDDIDHSLPNNAVTAVAGSLLNWEQWVENTKGVIPVDSREQATRALHAQGELWRRLLSGEKLAEDLLMPQNYRDAGTRMIRRFRSLAVGFLRSWWFIILPFFLVVAAIAWAIVNYAPSGATTTAALIATAAGALGISWKTVGSTVGRAASKMEAPLWDAEVRASIVEAATILPAI